ncbi:efflux RND transporter permease subunit [Sulfurimonas marina]|uniref:Efflux RND transporter permease subunit n=1 Tax=Sulfurimonas marina TaxID=2590551 RepID=A0A7M1AUH9_9BACT|nr:efflux RND transporter permease subunit [Sulfurimonas marina]QOP41077.1 efflux RND transporter permease subunit [Sulfurimonas marina]
MSNKHQGKKFENFIYDILQHRSKKLLVTALIFLSLFGTILMLPTEVVLARMLPGKSSNTFSIYVKTPDGSSISQTKEVVQCVEDILKPEKEVTDIESFIGEGAPLDYAGLVKGSGMKQGERFAEIVVNLTDKHHRDEKSFIMVQRLRPVIKNSCESKIDGTVIQMIEMPAGPPTMASIVVEVYGDSNTKVAGVANEVSKVLKQTDKIVDVDVMSETPYDKYKLMPISEKIARSGLSVEQVNQILYLAFKGMVVAVKNTIELNDQVGIFVSLSDETKDINENSLASLRTKLSSLYLMNNKGMMIPLTEVVEIKEVKSDRTIYHKDLKTMINVTAETDNQSQVYPLLDARDKMIKYFSEKGYEVNKEPGISTYMFDLTLVDKKTGEEYLLRWDGEMKVTLDTFRDLGAAFIAALILIFLLMVIYYKSYAISGIILGGSFLSIIGVILGHWVANLFTEDVFFLTATSLIGFIALIGISSRNSLLLVDFTKDLIKNNGIEKQRAIAIASATRLKPILLTAIAIILGSSLLASDPVFGGLGVALISGTVVAVIVSIIFVPVLMDNTEAI